MDPAGALAARAERLGLLAGWSGLSLPGGFATEYLDWLAEGRHAGMDYLRRTAAARVDPARAFPWARSALVVAAPYFFPELDPPPGGLRVGRVARYAWSRDYHRALGAALAELEAYARELGLRARGYVDHGPLPEVALARGAGLGWVGRNTLIVREGAGSYWLLGVLLVSLEVSPPPAAPERCGACFACGLACPGGALGPWGLDARRCVSYWTIEHRGPIPAERWGEIGGWLFGCDLCQEACPWNRFAPRAGYWRRLEPEPELAHPDLWEFLDLSGRGFLRRFGDTAFARAGRAGMVRNAIVVLHNLGHPELEPYLLRAAADPSPGVRMAAAQGFWRLGVERLTDDPDPRVAGFARSLWER